MRVVVLGVLRRAVFWAGKMGCGSDLVVLRGGGGRRVGVISALLQQVLAMTPEQMDRLTPVQRTQVEQLRAAAMSQGRM